MGDMPGGFERLNRAIGDEEKLLKNDPLWAELRGALSRHYLSAAAAAVASRNWKDGERHYKDAVELSSQTVEAHPKDANAQENLAAACLGNARILAHSGGSAEAARLDRKAASEAQAILSLHPVNPTARAILDHAVHDHP